MHFVVFYIEKELRHIKKIN